MHNLLDQYKDNRRLTTLVENRTTYNADYAELNIYETQALANKVSLTFDFPVIASMLTGKKVMHLKDMPAFDFFPGESVVIPAKEEMVIDFPLATKEQPTQCLALGIDANKIEEVVGKFNDYVSIDTNSPEWNLDENASHLVNNTEVNLLVQRLTHTFMHNNRSKDVLLDLMIQELIVRLLQTKAKHLILNDTNAIFSDTRIGAVIKYIKNNLTNKDLSIDTLSNLVHMSHSHFHKHFKNTLGISPIEYVNTEKIKFAKRMIKKHKSMSMGEIAHKSGFNSTSYFNRQFKKIEMMTPQQFKKSVVLA